MQARIQVFQKKNQKKNSQLRLRLDDDESHASIAQSRNGQLLAYDFPLNLYLCALLPLLFIHLLPRNPPARWAIRIHLIPVPVADFDAAAVVEIGAASGVAIPVSAMRLMSATPGDELEIAHGWFSFSV